MIRLNWLLLLIFLAFMIGNTSSVTAQTKWAARDSMLQDFKEGTLVVRLKSHEKKLKKINELIKGNDIDNSYKKRLEDKRDYIVQNRDRFNQELVAAFNTQYNFSTVVFMFDKDLKKFKEGKRELLFLDQHLDYISEPPSLPGSIYYFGEGQTNTSGNSISGLLVMDTKSQQLPSWFPNFYRAKSNLKSFFGMFSSTKYTYRPPEKVIGKFQADLNRLWKKLQERQNPAK